MSENKKPMLILEDRSLLFAQRYGYVPLPDIMNYKLCEEFRDELYQIINNGDFVPDGLCESVGFVFRKEIEKMSSWDIENDNFYEPRERLTNNVIGGEFWKALSIVELILRFTGKDSPVDKSIRDLFARGLAPYTIDDSDESICIIPLDTPESAGATVACLEDLYQAGAVSAHQRLRKAAKNINRKEYGSSVSNSVHAVESAAKEIAGLDGKLGSALDELEKDNVIDHPALKGGIAKLYGYASDTDRHGQTSEKAAQTTVTRDEALLIFSTCTAIAGYLVRKSGRVKQQDVDDDVPF